MKYIFRSIKYLLAVSVFCVVLTFAMDLTGASLLDAKQTFYVMFHSWRGAVLPITIVLVSLAYPRFGFTVRELEGSVAGDREQIDTAFEVAGYALDRMEGEVMVWRAESLLRRATMLFEDEVRVSQQEGNIVLDGNRRGVARVDYQLRNYLRNKRRNG